MKSGPTILLLMWCFGVAACERPQWLVHLYTDARVPQFGDRLLVEFFDEKGAAIPAGRRLMSASEPSDWPKIFGFAFTDSAPAPLLVRARLYREEYTNAIGEPEPAFIDAVGRLPSSAPQGVQHLAMGLTLNCFGVAVDLTDPLNPLSCDPAVTKPSPVAELPHIDADAVLPLPDSWIVGMPQPCPTNLGLPAELACVPGGTFVLSGTKPKVTQQSPTRLAVLWHLPTELGYFV